MDAVIPHHPTDPWAIDGKFAPPEEHAELLVIGAGPTGLAAAIEAARLGLRVVLIDENPVPLSLMGIDVPLFYGQRMNAAVQEQARMVERLVASDPAIEAAFDAGVDVRLGITAWGAFANGPALQSLPERVVGLTDGTRSWLCGFGALILATGARDLVLSFDGIDLPGVMGAQALNSLLSGYNAFDGKRIAILGTGPLATATANTALTHGLEVAALIDILPEAQGPQSPLGIPLLTNVTAIRAEPGSAGVAAALVISNGVEHRVACDTICLAVGTVPTIELAGTLGCRLSYDGASGGHIPVTDPQGATSLPGIFAAGDCAGLPLAVATATAQAAAAWLKTRATPTHAPRPPAPDTTTAYRLAWMRALLATSSPQTHVCLCEEVTRAEFLGIQPPRYLAHPLPARDGQTLLQDGPFNPDQIKRLTRAGMGPCQGRRCREQIALTLAVASNTSPAAIPLATYRAPVRPLPLSVIADTAETQAMKAGWDVWFGIRAQWVPYDIIGTPDEDAFLAAGSGGNMHA